MVDIRHRWRRCMDDMIMLFGCGRKEGWIGLDVEFGA